MTHHSNPMQRDLYERLVQLGCSVGRSKSGILLRIDNRSCRSPIEHDLLQSIFSCHGLRELYLCGLQGLNRYLPNLCELEKLRILDVAGSDFSDDSLEAISQLTCLQLINVRGTPVTAGRVAQVRKKMIGARIVL